MTEPANKFELQHLRRQLLDTRAQHAVRPVRLPLRPVVPLIRQAQIVNGQLINTIIPVIQYVPDPLTVPTAYDPNVDTSYVAGIGNGYLYNQQGQRQTSKVLIRHNWVGFASSLIAGDVFQVGDPVPVAVTGGGTIYAYPIIGAV